MQVHVLKYGNLMGSPDVKAMQQAAGVGSQKAHALFEDLFRIKLTWGLNGQATSLLLLEQKAPNCFPAVVDLSYISPDPTSHSQDTIQTALQRLLDFGVKPEQVKSYLVTHNHGDHFDHRLLEHFTGAAVVEPRDLCASTTPPGFSSMLSKWIEVIETPGHGAFHQSFVFDQNELDCSVCIAGDLIMSHAHFLDLDHPLAFTDHRQGKKSVQKILANLAQRQTRYKLIIPGHDVPFFTNPYLVPVSKPRILKSR